MIDELLQVPEAVRLDWEAYVGERSGDDPETTEAKLRDELLSSLQAPSTDADARYAPEPPTTPLKSHTGRSGMRATTRSLSRLRTEGSSSSPRTGRSASRRCFPHVATQTLFTMRLAESASWGGQDQTVLRAEFRLGEGGQVSGLGIEFDKDVAKEDKLIWFTRN